MSNRIGTRRQTTASITTLLTPTPPSHHRNTITMSPLPPTHASASPITSDPHRHIAQHHKTTASPTPYNPAYENFILLLIAAYLIWALFYGIYMLLRISIWICEKAYARLETIFCNIMAWKLDGQLRCQNGQAIEVWAEPDVSEKVHVAWRMDSGVWITVQRPEKNRLEYIVRRRSGTI